MRRHTTPSDAAFSAAVKAVQLRKGSRAVYERVETLHPWDSEITPELARFIEMQTSVFFATASRDGQPYIQHRGGPAGFLHVLDGHTLGFADLPGNRQYITLGNLAENPKAHLFLIDYARRRRIKLWGEARVVETDRGLLSLLTPPGTKVVPEQAILFTVSAWDSNCPNYIPRRFEAADVTAALSERDARIVALEAEIKQLRDAIPHPAELPAPLERPSV